MREFVGGHEWSRPTFNPSEFGELQNQVISNMIYYQSNYGAFAIPFLLLVGYGFSLSLLMIVTILLFSFFRPAALIVGLLVFTVLLAGFVYSTRQNKTLTTILHDRPIIILILLLVLAFMIVRMFGTVFIFIFGIALPLTCKSCSIAFVLIPSPCLVVFLVIVGHATARTQTLQNKAENTVESLALQSTPMGLLLGWLGAKANEERKPKDK